MIQTFRNNKTKTVCLIKNFYYNLKYIQFVFVFSSFWVRNEAKVNSVKQ